MEIDISKLTLEEIDKYGISIYQDPKYFKFSIDAFCLADFAKRYIKKESRYMDLCSGTGIVGILISQSPFIDRASFVEINPYFVAINKINLQINRIEGDVVCRDIRDLSAHYPREYFDAISINPPYMKEGHGLKTINFHKDLAKIEGSEDFLAILFNVAFYLLRDKGELYMVHRVERLVDIFEASRKHKMEAKTMQFIRNKKSKKASLVLLRFVKNGGRFLDNLDDYVI